MSVLKREASNHHNAAPTNVIVDLVNGPEDSVYEDFDDELDV